MLRDKKYCDFLKDSPCAVTGRMSTDNEKVDPAHIGTGGMALKTHDCFQNPLIHSEHMAEHTGWVTYWLSRLKDKYLLKEVLRCWAFVRYLKWKLDIETMDDLVEWISND